MIGLDTNVIVRYLVKDDPEQGRVASQVFASLGPANPGHISVVTLIEVFWVLGRAYKVEKSALLEIVGALLESAEVIIGDAESVHRALASAHDGLPFVDSLIAELARRLGAHHTVTFDRCAAEHPDMRLL